MKNLTLCIFLIFLFGCESNQLVTQLDPVLVEAQKENPEMFGQKILRAQITLEELQATQEKLQQSIQSPDATHEKKQQLAEMHTAVQQQEETIQAMYKVIAASMAEGL